MAKELKLSGSALLVGAVCRGWQPRIAHASLRRSDHRGHQISLRRSGSFITLLGGVAAFGSTVPCSLGFIVAGLASLTP